MDRKGWLEVGFEGGVRRVVARSLIIGPRIGLKLNWTRQGMSRGNFGAGRDAFMAIYE